MAVVIWSFFTVLTPLCAAYFWPLMFARIGMGMGEGIALPAIHSLVSKWIPSSSRSRSLAMIGSGHALGMGCVHWQWAESGGSRGHTCGSTHPPSHPFGIDRGSRETTLLLGEIPPETKAGRDP